MSEPIISGCYGHPMEAEPQRCETHGVVLSTTGACLLCERRGKRRDAGNGTTASSSGGSMLQLLLGVVGVLITCAIGFRVYRVLTDRPTEAATARAEPNITPPDTAAPATANAPSGGGGGADDPRDHQRLVVEAERSVRIEFYGAAWCPSCRNAKAWLDAQRIDYTYRDVDADRATKQALRALNPRGTIPTIDIEGQVIVGFNASAMRAAIRSAAEARGTRGGR